MSCPSHFYDGDASEIFSLKGEDDRVRWAVGSSSRKPRWPQFTKYLLAPLVALDHPPFGLIVGVLESHFQKQSASLGVGFSGTKTDNLKCQSGYFVVGTNKCEMIETRAWMRSPTPSANFGLLRSLPSATAANVGSTLVRWVPGKG